MMKRALIPTLLAAIWLPSSAAYATTIVTPILAVGTPFGGSCLVVNASTSAIDVTVEFVDQDGSVVQTTAPTIQPDSIAFEFLPSPIAASRVFCRVQGQFSRKLVKAAFSPTGSDAVAYSR